MKHKNTFQSKKLLLIKYIYIVLLTASYLAVRFNFHSQSYCYKDIIHDITAPINSLLKDPVDNLVIGIGQILMDGWILSIFIVWIIKCKNTRLGIAVFSFHLIRNIIFLNIEALPFPANIIWHSPGFPSLTVPYDHTRDFFYSGHTGTMLIIACEYNILRYKKISIFSFISLIYMIWMLIVTRVHYSIDIVGGLIFSMFFYKFADRNKKTADYLVSMPYLLGQKIYNKYKQSRSSQQRQRLI